MTKIISPYPKLQFIDANGDPYSGGKLYTYVAGTTTPVVTYTDSGGGTENANPIILDTRGECDLWLSSATYKYVLKTSGGTTVWTVDNIVALAAAAQYETIVIACSDETTAINAATALVTFRIPYAYTLTGVRASLTTAQTSGNIFKVDINDSGTTILSTKLTIDNNETTSTTAVTAAVLSDTSFADDASITIDVDQIGNGTAKGLKVSLIGYRT